MNVRNLFFYAAAVILLSACAASSNSSMSKENKARAATAYAQLGVEYLREGNYEMSQRKLQKALSLEPELVDAHDAIALLYEQVGEDGLAEKHFKTSLRLNPKSARSHNNYGQYLCSRQRYKEAHEQFMTAANNQFYATPALPLFNAGLCARRIPDLKVAEQHFRAALEKNPKYPPALLQMGVLSFDENNYLSARAYIQRFQQVSKHNPESLWLAVRTEFALQDHEAWGNYALDLKNNFPESEQSTLLREWENDRRARQ